MQRKSSIRLIAAFLACLGCCIPRHLLAAQSGPTDRINLSTLVFDVQLQDGGIFQGKYMAPNGVVQPGTTVNLRKDHKVIATTALNADGRFGFAEMRGGVFEVEVEGQVVTMRCWAPGTAPPHAMSELDCNQAILVRGQSHPLAAGLGNPLVIAAIVATAIAIPIVISDHRNDRTAD